MKPVSMPDRFNLHRVATVFFIHKKLIAWGAVIGLAGAAIYLVKDQPPATATARMIASYEAPTVETDVERALHIEDRMITFSRHLHMLQSRPLLELVADRLDTGITVDDISSALTVSRIQATQSGGDIDILEVRFSHADPGIARKVANEVCRTYEAYLRRTHLQHKATLIARHQRSIQRIRQELARSEERLRRFEERHVPGGPEAEHQRLGGVLSRMETELDLSRIELAQLNTRRRASLSRVRRLNRTQLTAVVRENALVRRIDDLKTEVAELSTQYSKKHPRLQAARQKLANLEEKAVKGGRATAVRQTVGRNPLRTSLERMTEELAAAAPALAARVRSNREALEELRSQLRAIPELEQRHDRLARKAGMLAEELDKLTSNRQILRLSAMFPRAELRTLEPADTPVAPARDSPLRTLVTWLLTGVAIATATAVLLERLDRTIKDPDILEETLGIPLLGITQRLSAAEVLSHHAATGAKSLPESLSAVRSHVKHVCRIHRAKVLLVCSPLRQDGRTTVATSMALSFARDGKRTVLINADLRRPEEERLVAANR